ncbi:NHLP family bacteriocin export ABC transporter peptidase/permease/ATPase subunit [Sporomusa malonica]|uniref:NHLM bacteriocin system ABC transporter, peptidase/ATP-binding protein n=1 Tax=Sporomusa malonica TaxID=112901 RepID=A0A1W2CWA6_9FIRM|nr:NHLP family bacteriocin export ABC transporter peptidase/permease/ATPase subunit [Sporomusa malonica]SMC89527.1 NHLM bacteriocin system ABC transporter, peptidase/ATP-binding protein [Sporomusa malonica]
MNKNKRVKTPVVLQMEAVECGAASLSIILSHYGLFLPLEKLRMECGVSRDGAKASSILKAARRLGMEAKGWRYSAEELKNKEFPLIIHWNFYHFLVLEGFKDDKVYLNDPGSGHRTVSWEEFETSYTGVAINLTPGANFQKGGSAPSTVAALVRRISGNKTALLFALITGLGLIIPGLAIPVFSQVFFDDILSRKHTDWLFNLLLAMGITVVLQGALTWVRSWCLTRWQGSMTIGDSSRYLWHLLRLPIDFFQQRSIGEVASRLRFNESVASVLTGQAATAVLDVTVAVFYLVLLLQYNVTLTIIGVVFTLINLGVLRLMFRWAVEQQMKIQQEMGKAYGVAIAGIQTIETIKANGNEGDFFTKWAGYQSKMVQTTQTVELSAQFFTLAPALLNGLNTAVIMAVGGFQIMDGLMTVGIFVAFQNLMGRFQEPVGKLIALSQSLQTTETQMHRLDDVLRYPQDETVFSTEQPPPLDVAKLSGRVDLRDVTFGYSRLEAPLIERFSLVIEPGRRVALVGGSGSGKSTVAKLVAGLYQPWSGEIEFDGLPRQRIPREVMIKSLAAVDQDIFLFEGSVADNLSLFDAAVRRPDIVRAAKDAAIHDDIAELQGGYEALVEEGGRNFSGGQRQRLEIARTLAGNPSILLLDEATSALDPLSEQLVTENIRRRGCACLVVAHRLSTIRDCDEIIVLKQGKVVQRGRHETMMLEDGPYKQLVDNDTGATVAPGVANHEG